MSKFPRSRRMFVSALAICLLVGMVGQAGAAHPVSEELVVDLDQDGSATIHLVLPYDLTVGSEQRTFRQLKTNETLRSSLETTYQDRMETIASQAANVTGRSMAVNNATVAFKTYNESRGIVSLSIEWRQLAKRANDRLQVTEPFASGFTPDRRFVVQAPAGYTITEAAPSATSKNETQAVWPSGTDLDGFKVVAVPSTAEQSRATATRSRTVTVTPTPTPSEPTPRSNERDPSTGTATNAPGFGITAVLVAVVILGAGLVTTRDWPVSE